MSCLSEERFVQLLDSGGLDAASPAEEVHFQGCQACREAWASIAAAAELLTEARPSRSASWIRVLPVAAAAAMLVTIGAVIALRGSPGTQTTAKDPVAQFLNGTPDEVREARPALLRMGRKALPGLVAARPRLRNSPRFQELQDVIWTLKASGVQGTPNSVVVRRLETMKVDLAFEKAGANEVLAFLHDFSGIAFVLDPTVDPGPVDSFQAKDLLLLSSLEIFCSLKDLDFDFRYGVVFLSRPMRLWSTDPQVGLAEANLWTKQVLDTAGQDIAAKMRTFPITLDMQNSPLDTGAAYVSAVSGIPVELPEAQLRDTVGLTLMTIQVSDLPMNRMVELLTLPLGLDARIEGDKVLIFDPQKK